MTAPQRDDPRVASVLGCDLYAEFAHCVDAGSLVDELVREELARWSDTRIQEFVPIFVRRRVRAQLRQLVTDGIAQPDRAAETERTIEPESTTSSVDKVSV